MFRDLHIEPSQNPRNWQKILLIAFVLLAGLSLRLYALENVFLWNDETDNFDEQIFGHMSTSLRRYAALESQELTLGPAWSLIIALTCRVFGGVVSVGRMPSVLFGTAAILCIFYLVYRLLQPNDDERLFAPAFVAAVLAAVSIIQIQYSQRIIPYGAVPLLTTAIMIAHLKIVHIIQKKLLPTGKLILWCILYTLIAGFSVYLHLSVTMILFASFIMLFHTAFRSSDIDRDRDRDRRIVVFGLVALTSLAVSLAWIGNVIHTQSGYRFYLAPYYHPLNLGAIPFLLSRAYDLLTYNLNLFYNGALYWPRRLNPVLLPLILMCVVGWCRSVMGRFGWTAKHLSLFGTITILLTALLSLLERYPFGGVRQTLFMSPFIYTFTAMGFWTLMRSRFGKAVAGVTAMGYLILWGINLPHFYKERVSPYTTQDLVSVWEEHGKCGFYGDGGCGDTIRYVLRDYPDIQVQNLDYERNIFPEPPFFLISPHWPMEDSLWLPHLKARFEELGYHAKLIMLRDAAYHAHPEYRQCLYSPPNGLWLYKITKERNQES
ncbi:MAG: hypothetical protein P8Z79_18710 [Sedimentisphaerales bacterium]